MLESLLGGIYDLQFVLDIADLRLWRQGVLIVLIVDVVIVIVVALAAGVWVE